MRDWWRLPWWLISPLTGAKSFVDNPIIGSVRLNQLGLHVARLRAAHASAHARRKRLAKRLPPDLRQQFETNGFIVVPDFVDPAEFADLCRELLELDVEARSQRQGDTITTRVPIGPDLLAAVPRLAQLLRSASWQSILHFVASFGSQPLYYLQAIRTGTVEGPPDPQQNLHSDTFHPSMKAWLFLSDIGEEDAPLTYVAGSHRLTPERIAWEKAKSIDVLASGDRLSQRGSMRITPDELEALGLPKPTRFTVPANTLVVIDTCGFHARGRSTRPTVRTEIWAYSRRSPLIPWTGLDLLSFSPFADRRAEWLAAALDRLDRKGWAKQHWKKDGAWRDHTRHPAPPVAGRVEQIQSTGSIPSSETV